MYTIEAALVFKNKHDLMFLDYGMIVEGPKGGIYLIDGFCTEQWLRHVVNAKLHMGEEHWTVVEYMKKAIRKNKIEMVYVDVDNQNDFITPKEYKGKKELRRKKGFKYLIESGMMHKIQPIDMKGRYNIYG